MTPKFYNVIFHGELVEGYKTADVANKLAALFKVDANTITQRLFTHNPSIVKKNIDHATALKYQRAFEKAGAICHIEPRRPQDTVSALPSRTPQPDKIIPAQPKDTALPPRRNASSKTSLSRRKDMMTCPKCGYQQEAAEACGRCGIIITKHEDKQPDLPRVTSSSPKAELHVQASVDRAFNKARILGILLIILLTGAGTFLWWSKRPVSYGPGIIAPDIPEQTTTQLPSPFAHKAYRITPLANFHIRAKVLSKKTYSMGRETDLSPVDLALGWGPMSDETVLKDIKISQSNRWYHWRVNQFPISQKEIEEHSANMHMIPADSSVEDTLDEVQKGHLIELKGYLVRVDADDGWRWKSSLTRKDTGDGACEVIWVEEFEISE